MRRILLCYKVFSVFPRFSPTIFYRDANNSVLLQILAHLCTAELIGSMRRTLCLALFARRARRFIYTCTAGMFSRTLYAWNPVSRRNIPSPPALANDFRFRCKFSSLTSHLCTAVDSMRRKPWVRNCPRERKGLYNGNVQQNPLCAASYFAKDIPSLPGSRLRFFIAGQIQHRTVHRFLFTPAQVDAPMYSSSRLYSKNPMFEIVHEESVKVYHLHMYNWNIQQNSLCH